MGFPVPIAGYTQADDTLDKGAVRTSDHCTWAAYPTVRRCPTLTCAGVCRRLAGGWFRVCRRLAGVCARVRRRVVCRTLTRALYTTLHYTTLHYTTLHCTALHYTTLHYTTLHYTTLHYTTLHYTTLHYTTLHYTTLHYTTLHYTTLHYTTLPLSESAPHTPTYGTFIGHKCGSKGPDPKMLRVGIFSNIPKRYSALQ